jgi:hypothetical protein
MEQTLRHPITQQRPSALTLTLGLLPRFRDLGHGALLECVPCYNAL